MRGYENSKFAGYASPREVMKSMINDELRFTHADLNSLKMSPLGTMMKNLKDLPIPVFFNEEDDKLELELRNKLIQGLIEAVTNKG
jgi:hypothetical protein